MRKILGSMLAGVMSVAGMSGCLIQQPNPDINRVQKPYLPKGWFADGQSWYLRRTIVDAPPQSWFAIGDGDWPSAQRIRFEIRQDQIFLYRDYELVPGSETAEQPGVDYKGVPIVAFPITEHFDIRRQYNPLTGEQTNVVEKNTERPWFEREFFNVDWGAPYVQDPSMLQLGWLAVSAMKGAEAAFYAQEHEVTNPDRARFSSDYLEFTRREAVGPDIYACLGGLGYGKAPDCGAGIVDVRWSFERINPELDNDFEPTPFPDSVSLVDGNGEAIKRDGRDVKIPIFDKFGFFRLERLTYDRDRGVTDNGRIMRAFKFNLWERSHNADGSVIPYDQRTPRPIVYYMNADVPEDEWSANSDRLASLTIQAANREIGDEFNKVFREIVETMQGRALPADVKMFQVRDNDCRFSNMKEFAERNDLRSALDPIGGFDGVVAEHDAVGAACRADPMGRSCSSLRQKWGYKLRQACTALESATENAAEGEAKFTWQRLGDVRYSFIHLTSHLQSVGWLGLGMLAADPITGQIRNAFAYVDGPGTDYSATQALDMVDAMNNQTLESDLIFGTDIARYTEMQNAKVGAKTRNYPDASKIRAVERKFQAMGNRPEEMLREGESLAAVRAKLESVKGTPAEMALLNQDDLILAAAGPLGATTAWTDDMLNKMSPARGGGVLAMREETLARHKRAMGAPDKMGRLGPCHYMREFLDEGIIGLATEIRDWERQERWAYLRKAIYKTVMLHEVGHTLGLRHNFQGTWDALNFHDAFWDRLQYFTYIPQAGAERVSRTVEEGIAIAENLIPTLTGQQAQQFTADLALLRSCEGKISDNRNRFVTECVAADTGPGSEVTKFRECSNQLPAAEAAGVVLVVDAMQCVRAEEGKSSSVMDYHGKFNGRFAGLGHYDAAALKFGYAQIVEEFAPSALKTLGDTSDPAAVKDWLFEHDYKRIPDELTNGPEGVRARVNVHKPWGATTTRFAPSAVDVPYGFCSDEYAYFGMGGTDVCRLRDHGANHREQMEHDLLRYKQYYFFSNFARNRLTWDIGSAIGSNAGIFNNILNTFQYMYLYRAFSPDFFEKDIGKDFLAASLAGLDLYSEVLAMPEMGTFVSPRANWGFTRNSQVRGRWLRTTVEENLDLPPAQLRGTANDLTGIALPTYFFNTCEFGDSATYDCNMPGGQYPGFVCTNQLCGIDIPLGDGRPSYLNFTADYEDWFFTYVGNYFDKENILVNLVYSQAFFPRLSDEQLGGGSNPNVRLLNVGLSNLFGDSIKTMLYGVITDRVTDYASTYRPSTGEYLPRSFNILEEDTSLQADDVVVMPRRITNIPYIAMLYATAFQSSLNDGVLDFLSVIQVGVKGEEDDVRGWDSVPANQKAEFLHPQTGVTYRAVKVGDKPVGYDLVQEALRYKTRYQEFQACVDQPGKSDGRCSCTYVGAFNAIDKNLDGDILGTGDMNNPNDECVLSKPENGLMPCEARVEPCETADRVDARDRALERMEAVVERLENVRSFYRSFSGSRRL